MIEIPVSTSTAKYKALVGRGVLANCEAWRCLGDREPFVVTNPEIWRLHGNAVLTGLGRQRIPVLEFQAGEAEKRLQTVERLAEELVELRADRKSAIVALGGGVVGDVAGFLAAIFMRGIPVVQAPTTLLAQVDAAIGGKTGVNLVRGKNLVGSFHQPLAVLIDSEVLSSLPDREFYAGLFEVLKYAMICDAPLFDLLESSAEAVRARNPAVLDKLVAACVRIKAEVVGVDEQEHGLRKILNFGHTFGHALEAETGYNRFLHGEAVGFGMVAATFLAEFAEVTSPAEAGRMRSLIRAYGPIPPASGIIAPNLRRRLGDDKKAEKGVINFVIVPKLGEARVASGFAEAIVLDAIQSALEFQWT